MFKRTVLLICLLIAAISSMVIRYYFVQPAERFSFPRIESYDVIIPEVISQAGPQTLILFDIDDTLVVTDVPDFDQTPWYFKTLLLFRHPSLLIPSTFEHYFSMIWSKASFSVIEPILPKFINEVKSKGCIVLACSSVESGSYGIIKSFPEQRYQALKSIGIEFTQTYPDVSFDALPEYRGTYPLLYKGILCCNQQKKAVVIAAFLEHYKISPKLLIFFEDSAKTLTSVAQMCRQRVISFQGYLFVRKPKPWDTQRVLKAFDRVIKEES